MKLIQFLFLIFLLSSCVDKTPDRKRNLVRYGFEVKVVHSAGDQFEKTLDSLTYNFLPYVGNIAQLKNFDQCQLEFLILSHSIRKNFQLNVIPIAILGFIENGIEQKVIVSVPENEDIRAIPVDNFEEFVVKYFSVQQIIENWYQHRLGFGKVRDLHWNNELSAIRSIEACIFQ